MSVIKCDTDKLDGTVKNFLTNALSTLEEGANIISAISIPSSFSLKGELSNIPNEVNNSNNAIESLKSWVSDVVNKFTNAEESNKSVINQLNDSLANVTSVLTSSNTMSSTGAIAEVENSLFGILGNLCVDLVLEPDKTSVKKTDIGAELAEGWESFLDVVSNGWDAVTDFFSSAADVASDAWHNFTEQVKPVVDVVADALAFVGEGIATITCAFVASIVNVVFALLKGILLLVENIIDFIILCGGIGVTLIAGFFEAIFTTPMIIDEGIGEWFENLTEDGLAAQIMKGTMSIVSNEVVNGLYDMLYDTPFGKWNDEHTIGVLRSDGIVYNFISGIGYITGIILITLATMGIGGAAAAGGSGAASAASGITSILSNSSLVGAIISFMAGTGKYTEQKWVELKDNSWSTFEEMHENGEISDDLYNTVLEIRKLSDEEWESTKAEILNQAENKEEAEYAIEMLESYRNLTEGDWRNVENFASGTSYGVLNGAWEGIQWYIGSKMSGMNKVTGLAKSFLNVGVDTLFNGADTFARAGIDSLTFGTDFGEAFENNGAWGSVIENVLIGLIFSAGSEFFDYKFGSKTSDTNNTVLTDTKPTNNIRNGVKTIDDQLKEVCDYLFDGQNTSENIKNKIREVLNIINSSGALQGVDDNIATKVINDFVAFSVDGSINPADIRYSHIKQSVNFFTYWDSIKNKDLTVMSTNEILNLFNTVFGTGEKSNYNSLLLATDAFRKSMANGSNDAKEILQTLIKLKIEEPKLHFDITPNRIILAF